MKENKRMYSKDEREMRLEMQWNEIHEQCQQQSAPANIQTFFGFNYQTSGKSSPRAATSVATFLGKKEQGETSDT
jgi:hypothetical protein